MSATKIYGTFLLVCAIPALFAMPGAQEHRLLIIGVIVTVAVLINLGG
jgi:hypothetical protein